MFIRNAAGVWRSNKAIGFKTWRGATSSQVAYNTHSWDMIEHDGRVFVAGYGISASTDRLVKFTNATPTLSDGSSAETQTDPIEYIDQYYGGSAWHLLRQQHFLKIKDQLFSVYNGHLQPQISNTKNSYKDYNLGDGYWYNPSTKLFERIVIDLQQLYPGLTTSDFALSMGLNAKNGSGNTCSAAKFVTRMRVWHPTPFADRCLFVGSVDNIGYNVGSGDNFKYTSYPLSVGGFSAALGKDTTKYPHPIVSTKIDFGQAVFPMDFMVHDGVCYALTTRFDSTTKKVNHGIWTSTNGVDFTQITAFDFHQNFISFEKHDGYFYLGAGFKGIASGYAYDTGKADEAGAIYRIPDPQAPRVRVVATSAADPIGVGGSAVVAFSLSTAPSSNVTVSVAADTAHSVVLSRSVLTFTPSDYSVPQPVTVTARGIVDSSAIEVVCGVRDPSNCRGEFESGEICSAMASVPVVVPAAVSSVWLVDSANRMITDRVWKFLATVSGSNVTVGIPCDGDCPTSVTPLDFSKPVVDISDAGRSYTLVTLNPAFCPNGGTIKSSALSVGELTLPGAGLSRISADAFSNCSNLCGNIVFPPSMTNISAAAFKNTAVDSVDFKPAAATMYGGYQRGPFYSCKALKNIRFREGGAYAFTNGHHFAYCTALKNADFSGVRRITVNSRGYAALGYCSAMTNVVVDPSIVLVNTTTNSASQGTCGNALLYSNAGLRTIHFTGAPTATFADCIENDGGYLYWVSSSQTVTTYVPSASVNQWKVYAANQTISSSGSTFAANYLKSGITLSRRQLVSEIEAPVPSLPLSKPVLALDAGGAVSEDGCVISVSSPVAGAYYTLFTTTSLFETFRAAADSVRCLSGGNPPVFVLPRDTPSKFATVTVSTEPVFAGTSLEAASLNN